MRRNVLVAGLLAGTIGASGLGWVAGRSVQSPAQIAANTAPPAPSLITVAVEYRQLSADVIVRGTVRYGAVQPVTIIASALKSAGDILTVAPVAGATVTEGRSVMTVSGRPVFVLRGAVPTYRDLAPGTEGVDVRQLQAALGRLGFYSGPATGRYDGGTAAAVTQWYQAAGFTPFGPTPSQITALQSAQANVSQAQSSALSAQATLAALQGVPLTVVQAIGAQRIAASAVAAAEAKAKADQVFGPINVQAKTLALETARLDASTAARALNAARANLDPATGLPPLTPEGRAVLQAAAGRAERALAVAQAALTAAQQANAATQQADAGAIASAAFSVQQAQAALSADQAALAADQQRCSLVAAEQNQVAQDRRNVQAAQDSYNASPSPSKQAALDRARATLAADEASLAADQQACGRIAADQRQVAGDAGTLQQAQVAVGAAQASATRDAAAAVSEVAARTAAIANAGDALATATRRLTAAGKGLDPTTGQPWITPGAMATLTDKAAASTLAAKTAAVDLAKAVNTMASSQQDDARAISDARNALITSNAELQQARAPITEALARQRAALAADDLQRARAALGVLSSTAGVTVPADEVLFFPNLPLRVDSVKLAAGDAVTGEVMRVSTARLAVDSALSLGDATLVRVGSPATIQETNLGITVPGTVTRVGLAPGTNGVDPQHVYLEVTPMRAPPQLVGASVKLTISVKSTAGKVLVVPASALSVASDGTSRVQVQRASGTTFVPVVPGLGAQGLVQVRATGAALAAGDRVVVGLTGPVAAALPSGGLPSGTPALSPSPGAASPRPTAVLTPTATPYGG